jgi:hypothetical protein
MASALAVTAVAAAAMTAWLAGAAGPGQRQPPSGANHREARLTARPRLTIPVPYGAGVQALATAGPYLYLATDYAGAAPYALTAFNRVSGRLVRQVGVPSMPAALRTGPGGSVWLTFSPDQGGGPAGIWLLNADLTRRSAYDKLGPPDLLPTSPDTALLATQYGLTMLRMPPPGAPGHATARADPAAAISGRLAVDALTPIGGRVAAQVTNGYGLHSQVVIAGQPGRSYGGSPDRQVGYLTAEDNGLWATTFPNATPNRGPLIRLSPLLRVITPPGVQTNPIFGQSEQVWSRGSTTWVATASAGHPLVCFTYRGRMGAIATVPVPGQPIARATAGNTVYVSLATSVADITSDVFGYAIPAGCR